MVLPRNRAELSFTISTQSPYYESLYTTSLFSPTLVSYQETLNLRDDTCSTVKSRKPRSYSGFWNWSFLTPKFQWKFCELLLISENISKEEWTLSEQKFWLYQSKLLFSNSGLYISTLQKLKCLHRESVNLIGDLQDLTGQSPR